MKDRVAGSAETAEPAGGRARRLGRAARLVMSLLLVGYVVWWAEWSQVVELLRQAEPMWLALFALITPVIVAVSVWKWQLLLAARGHRVGFGRLYGIYVVSQFYGNLLPSSVGGDVVRAVALSRQIHAPKDVLASIVVERFTGLTVLIAITVVAVAAVPALRAEVMVVVMVGAAVAIYLGVLVAILDRRVIRLMRAVLGRWALMRKLLDKLDRFQGALHAYGRCPGALAQAMGLSLVFYATAILNVYLACRGLGESVGLVQLSVVVPIVLTVAILPLTLSGIGLTEWAFMTSFMALGLSPTVGLTSGLLVRAKGLAWTSGGYLVCTLMMSRPPSSVAAAKEGAV